MRRDRMNKLVNAVVGNRKDVSPARRYVTYALLGTVVAFLLSVIILIASSIAFSVADGDASAAGAEDMGGGDGGGGAYVGSGAISYEVIDSDSMDAKRGEIVVLADVRTKLTTGSSHHYYAKNDKDGTEKLTRDTALSLDKMMIAFYNANKNVLVVDTEATNCNIPLIANTDENGYSFDVVRYHDDKAINGNDDYKWLFDNAHTYGFVYTNNTFTYVGAPIANHIKNTASIVDFAQFISVIKDVKTNMSTTLRDSENKSVTYQMYYLSADDELKVPTNYEYAVISDGQNGHVVTVNMSKPITEGVG